MKALAFTDASSLIEQLAAALRASSPPVSVVAAKPSEDISACLRSVSPSIVLVDVDSVDWQTVEVVGSQSSVPIVVLSSRDSETDLVRAIYSGADAFLPRAVPPALLAARVSALLRRTVLDVAHRGGDLRLGDIDISLDNRTISVSGARILLTPTEHRVFYYLARNGGRVVSKESICRLVWPSDPNGANTHLKVFISRLRHKLASRSNAMQIVTERGRGYRLVIPRERPSLPQV